ncbi:hypothetical protein [uncultured Spirosoma sp.]|uniref:hypothetical protein n=1 Tax=uncultured Spirosoma sp. TaxID=278208 RepID=UPI00258CDC31|nr:hypothetical protein [uncultured Spirosoma sp.]
MKVIIDISEIKCLRTTRDELGADEIYVASFLSALKKKEGNGIASTLENEKPLWGKVTDVERNIRKGRIWTPTPNRFEIHVDNSTDIVGLKVGVYERDNGQIYNKMYTELTGLIIPNGFDLSTVVLPDEIELASMIKFLFNFFKKTIIHFGQDDLLGDTEVIVPIDELSRQSIRKSVRFDRHGGIYELSMTINVVGI